MMSPTFMSPRPIAIVILAVAATGFLPARQDATTKTKPAEGTKNWPSPEAWIAKGAGRSGGGLPNPTRPTSFVSAATFLDLANMGLQLRDFYGVQTPNPPVTRVHCPLLAWFGTKEPEIGTAADLDLLKSTLKRLPTGPSRVDTVMIENADHMYRGEEAQVAQTIATWANALVPPSARRSAAQKQE